MESFYFWHILQSEITPQSKELVAPITRPPTLVTRRWRFIFYTNTRTPCYQTLGKDQQTTFLSAAEKILGVCCEFSVNIVLSQKVSMGMGINSNSIVMLLHRYSMFSLSVTTYHKNEAMLLLGITFCFCFCFCYCSLFRPYFSQ